MHDAWTHQLETWLGYLLLLCAGVGFLVEQPFALYVVATSLILLVIIGIRNAWDPVLWTAQQQLTK